MSFQAHSIRGLLAAIAITATAAATAQTNAAGPYYATPSWDQTLPASTRFVVLSNFNNEAALDRETGLVWATTPGYAQVTPGDFEVDFEICGRLATGNRMGWRNPTAAEMGSLFDPSAPFPRLPVGHPFQLAGKNGLMPGTTGIVWWTGTTDWPSPTTRFREIVADLQGGEQPVQAHYTYMPNTTAYLLCVRGPSSAPM